MVRGSALEGVLLACADLDHVLGLFQLREGDCLCVHATTATWRAIREGMRLDAVLGHYAGLTSREPPGQPEPLLVDDGEPSGLQYETSPVPGKPPRYREGEAGPQPGDCVGHRFQDRATGGRIAVIPGLAAIGPVVLNRLRECDAVLIDGTFWSENELAELGAGDTPASAMGHLPVGGRDGSLDIVAGLPSRRRIYIHVNNTNPMILENSPQRREVESRGVEVGRDGLEVEI